MISGNKELIVVGIAENQKLGESRSTEADRISPDIGQVTRLVISNQIHVMKYYFKILLNFKHLS